MTFALAFALCLSFVAPSGERTYYARLRALGGGAHVASVARDVEEIAAHAGLRPELGKDASSREPFAAARRADHRCCHAFGSAVSSPT